LDSFFFFSVPRGENSFICDHLRNLRRMLFLNFGNLSALAKLVVTE